MNKIIYLIPIIIAAFISCNDTPPIDNSTMLDGDLIIDSTLYNPEKYLISQKFTNPTDSILNTPVAIVVHGYSATTYEWREFYNWSDTIDDYMISLVLLGGHGQNYETFKNSTWEDWQKPILDEYQKLAAKGYKNISFVGSSTACPLILNLLYNGKLNIPIPKNIINIDPIVVASNKILSIIKAVGPIIGYVSSDLAENETPYWYSYRPQETLQQLQELLVITRNKLEDGVKIDDTINFVVYKSINDPTADVISAPIMYNGISHNNGSNIVVNLLETNLHVFTCLANRPNVTSKDIDLQQKTFTEIKMFLKDNSN